MSDDLKDLFRKPLLSVYLYKSGSRFESMVTQYMIDGKGIYPPGLEGLALNDTFVEPTLSANAVSRNVGLINLPEAEGTVSAETIS